MRSCLGVEANALWLADRNDPDCLKKQELPPLPD